MCPQKFLQEMNLSLKYQYRTCCPSWTLWTLVLSYLVLDKYLRLSDVKCCYMLYIVIRCRLLYVVKCCYMLLNVVKCCNKLVYVYMVLYGVICCYMLSYVVVCCCVLLKVVICYLKLFEGVWCCIGALYVRINCY